VQLKDENHQEDQETRKKSQLKNDAGIDIYAGLKRLAEDRGKWRAKLKTW